MDASITLWRLPGDARDGTGDVECAMEQLAEGVFELSLRSGDRLLLSRVLVHRRPAVSSIA